MLSTELTKTVSRNHLNKIMERINLPHIPEPGTLEARTFRKSVVERIHRRKMEENWENSDGNINTSKGSRCCRKKSIIPPEWPEEKSIEIVWRRKECKTMESFETIISASILSDLNCIRCLKAINQSLSFWEEPHPDWEGLSIIGSYMWLLSFSVQHLIDEENPKAPRDPGVEGIRHKFQEIAQAGEIFSDMIDTFHEHTHRCRQDAAETVKRMVKKWKIESSSPFLKRPEKVTHIGREPKRRLGKGLSEFQNETELFKETVFHLNWTPLTVMLRSKEIGWQEYGTLNKIEKIHWFDHFVQRALDILELAAEDLTMVTGQISSINFDGSDDSKSHARELSGALLFYAKTSTAPKKSKPEETKKIIQLLSEYWFSIDILHEESHKLMRLIHETRDIIRTCYVYMDTFYKWDLPSYDVFLSDKETKSRTKDSSQTISNIREVWGKFISKEAADRKLSDISEMLVMMDFSTSAYQRILELRPIEAEEGMLMKLESQSLDEDLSFGLVSGVDVRKSVKD